jgi:GR25 family glycosyltransferase involved in LPS biosynthesis
MAKATTLENALYKLHHRIAGHFNTGYGLKLQKLDSQIAYDVMTHFFMQLKRPLLMIHDSAIVSVRDVETLKLCMVDAYRSAVFKELQRNGYTEREYGPLPKGLKVTSAEFNDSLTNTIYKALEGIDVDDDEWTTAIAA